MLLLTVNVNPPGWDVRWLGGTRRVRRERAASWRGVAVAREEQLVSDWTIPSRWAPLMMRSTGRCVVDEKAREERVRRT